MLTMQEALENGMTIFIDERHLCTECKFYSYRPFRGKCAAELVQYNGLNRCGKFTASRQEEEVKFWE
jgi:hypothetical protein